MRKLQIWCDQCGKLCNRSELLTRNMPGTTTSDAWIQEACSRRCADLLLENEKSGKGTRRGILP